jgi:hypothetical protein
MKPANNPCFQGLFAGSCIGASLVNQMTSKFYAFFNNRYALDAPGRHVLVKKRDKSCKVAPAIGNWEMKTKSPPNEGFRLAVGIGWLLRFPFFRHNPTYVSLGMKNAMDDYQLPFLVRTVKQQMVLYNHPPKVWVILIHWVHPRVFRQSRSFLNNCFREPIGSGLATLIEISLGFQNVGNGWWEILHPIHGA